MSESLKRVGNPGLPMIRLGSDKNVLLNKRGAYFYMKHINLGLFFGKNIMICEILECEFFGVTSAKIDYPSNEPPYY